MISQAHLLVPSPPLMTLFVSVILYFFYIHSLIIRSIHTRTMSLLFQILLYPPFNRTWRRNFYGFGNRSYSCLSLPAPVKPRLNSTTSLGNGKDISPWNGQVGKKRKKKPFFFLVFWLGGHHEIVTETTNLLSWLAIHIDNYFLDTCGAHMQPDGSKIFKTQATDTQHNGAQQIGVMTLLGNQYSQKEHQTIWLWFFLTITLIMRLMSSGGPFSDFPTLFRWRMYLWFWILRQLLRRFGPFFQRLWWK